MAINLDCPRCKTPLRVPGKLAGGYVNCPRCNGRLWAPKEAPNDATHAETIEILADSVSEPSMAPPPAPHKRVARFITAESADSTLRLGDDGRLPQLHLEEDAVEKKPDADVRRVPSWALLGLLGLSVAVSLALVLCDVPLSRNSAMEKKAEMRQKIEDHYFGAGTLDAKRLETYQLLLREAQQAYSRGDEKTQRERYRQVLDMLRAERSSEERGLTGSRSKDKELDEAISVLLSGG
jgi:hypothetical protein